MEEEVYYYGQGTIELAEIENGVPGEWIDIGDVSECTGSLSEESFDHKESRTGKKGTVREIFLGPTMTWNLNLHQLNADNVARFTQGTVSNVALGTVTAESLGTVAAGDEITLAHPGVSNLVITDSAGSPATISATHYEYDIYGDVKFKTLPTSPVPTQPLKAAYSHTAYSQSAFLNATRKTYALRYKGVNLAEDSKPVKMELYKVSASLLQTLSMITNGNQLAAAPVTLKALLDTSKPDTGNLGQYGRIIYINH